MTLTEKQWQRLAPLFEASPRKSKKSYFVGKTAARCDAIVYDDASGKRPAENAGMASHSCVAREVHVLLQIRIWHHHLGSDASVRHKAETPQLFVVRRSAVDRTD